jgi:hypothetical protein
MDFKTPFKDAIEKSPVPTRGNGGEYDKQEIPNTPARSGGAFPELYRDTTVSGTPGGDTFKSPFKDAIEK